MKQADEIIKKCFEKAKFSDDRAKYLFKLLSDEMDILLVKKRKKIEEDAITDIVLEGYTLEINGNKIESANNSYEYNGDKDFLVNKYFGGKPRGFNTIKGAMNYAETEQNA
jgi:hypothetical protein